MSLDREMREAGLGKQDLNILEMDLSEFRDAAGDLLSNYNKIFAQLMAWEFILSYQGDNSSATRDKIVYIRAILHCMSLKNNNISDWTSTPLLTERKKQ